MASSREESTKKKSSEQLKKSTQSTKKTHVAKFAKDVQRLTQENYDQSFVSYNDIYGSDDLDYDLIDGLYESTILNRLLNKIAANCVPDMYNVQIFDMDGNRMDDLELLCSQYHANFRRSQLKEIFLYMLLYGTVFTYIGEKEEDRPVNIFNIHPQYIKPVVKDGVIQSWTYSAGQEDVDIPVEDILCFAYDRKLDTVYGRSLLGSLVQTLHLLLNTELNVAEIVDKFAIPIIHWLVESEEDQELSDQELNDIVQSIQNQYEYSNDVLTDARITTDVIGSADGQYNLPEILQELKESLGILSVPFQLIGGKADNLSAIKVQVAQYLSDLQNYQLIVSDALIEQFYKPFLESQGKILGDDYLNIYLVFPVLSAEANSDAASWIFPAIKYGLISRDEARAQLGFRGKSLSVDSIEFIDTSLREIVEASTQNNNNGSSSSVDDTSRAGDGADNDKTPTNKSGKGDSNDKKSQRQQQKK
jgi:hypothetical protein